VAVGGHGTSVETGHCYGVDKTQFGGATPTCRVHALLGGWSDGECLQEVSDGGAANEERSGASTAGQAERSEKPPCPVFRKA